MKCQRNPISHQIPSLLPSENNAEMQPTAKWKAPEGWQPQAFSDTSLVSANKHLSTLGMFPNPFPGQSLSPAPQSFAPLHLHAPPKTIPRRASELPAG